MRKRSRGSQAGYTLLELTVGLALAGVLAAVTIPSFVREARTSRVESEVAALFTELRLREAAHLNETGRYLSTGVSESDAFPTTPSFIRQPIAQLPDAWRALDIRALDEIACSYVVIAGGPGDRPGPIATDRFGYRTPATENWFYMLARCYIDDDRDTYFFASSDNGDLRELGALDPGSFAGTLTPAEPVPGANSGSRGGGDSAGGHGNNGHGNNDDGVDSSNPGHGGPDEDPSGGVDDESQPGGNGGGGGGGGGSGGRDDHGGGGGGHHHGHGGRHPNAGGGNGTECIDGEEQDPGNSGGHNNAPEGSCDSTGT